MDVKLGQKKYDHVVFLLDRSKIVKYNKVLFRILVEGGEIPFEKDILYLKNSDNYMWFQKRGRSQRQYYYQFCKSK